MTQRGRAESVNSSLSYVIGIDDAPFDAKHRGDVPIVGAVFNGLRLEGVLTGKVRRDGANATSKLVEMVAQSRFASSLRAVFLQGVTLGGFNVVDLHELHRRIGLPVVVVCRRKPDLVRIRRALLQAVPGGARKWQLIEHLAPARAFNGAYIQCAGLSVESAATLVRRFAVNSTLPEPLRTAHLIAGALVQGESRHRA